MAGTKDYITILALRFLMSFHYLIIHLFLVLNNSPCSGLHHIFKIHLLKDPLVASKFG